ncbi:multidrug efflux SMR transporter [Microlunatus elymi]|uniref:Multidrug efflux SMR transporter n=1 Tax=Microlunatus elymi TaxID=2596828 RepID=A0A516Q441_9ACTN|nr:multidrug efflux SMR transporter [Microlunatus elymi]QDP97981.1 multidrug efflux SMR transporter [Microlunatus elymi]
MSWVVLIIAGMLEAVWATALSASQGFKRWRPAVIFVLGLAGSMAGLAYAMTSIPTGTAYAIWVGIGASLTVLWGVITGKERASVGRMLLLIMLVGCVVGLKVVS